MAGYENRNPDINRELGQAQNLAQLLENDPDARIFVYAGLDHIVEEEHDGRKRMAAPFSISATTIILPAAFFQSFIKRPEPVVQIV